MVPYTRRTALKTLPALAASLSGCSGLLGEDYSLPTATAWRYHIQEPTAIRRPDDGPLLVGSHSPFDKDPVIAGLDPETGEERWTVTGEKGRNAPVAADERFAYSFSKSEEVFAVDYRTGAIEWRSTIRPVDDADPGVVEFAPVPLGDVAVMPVSGTEDDVPDRLVGFDRESGEEAFTHDLPASLSGAPARAGDGLVVPLLDGTLRRVTRSGTEQWRVDVGAALSGVTVADGTAYVGSATEALLAFDAATGERLWRGPLRNTVFAPPLVSDGRVFVGGADYYLYAFDADTGERQWRSETASAITSAALVDGKLVTLSGGDHSQRGASGNVPFSPTVLSVHDTGGALVGEYEFEGYLDGGSVSWVAAADGGVYLGQDWELARLDPEVLDAE